MQNKINYKSAVLQQVSKKFPWILFLSFPFGITTWVFIGELWINLDTISSFRLLMSAIFAFFITLLFISIFYSISFYVSIKNFSFSFEENYLLIRRGFFGNIQTKLPYSDIRILSIKQNLIDKVTNSYMLNIEIHGIYRSDELSIILMRVKNIQVIKECIYGLTREESEEIKQGILDRMGDKSKSLLNMTPVLSEKEKLEYKKYNETIWMERKKVIKKTLFIILPCFLFFLLGVYFLKMNILANILFGYDLGIIIVVLSFVIATIYTLVITRKIAFRNNGMFPSTINSKNNINYRIFPFYNSEYRITFEEFIATIISFCFLEFLINGGIKSFNLLWMTVLIMVPIYLILKPLGTMVRKNYFLDSPETKYISKINFFNICFFTIFWMFWGVCFIVGVF